MRFSNLPAVFIVALALVHAGCFQIDYDFEIPSEPKLEPDVDIVGVWDQTIPSRSGQWTFHSDGTYEIDCRAWFSMIVGTGHYRVRGKYLYTSGAFASSDHARQPGGWVKVHPVEDTFMFFDNNGRRWKFEKHTD